MKKADVQDVDFDISPDDPKPGIPIKKGTLFVMLLVVLAGAGVSSLIMSSGA
jgi:hypothetical protein